MLGVIGCFWDGGGGIPLTGLIPDSLLRDTVRANFPGGDKAG